jgi:hypothetical protein
MQRFRSLKTLQKFSSVHAQVHNYFHQERHLVYKTSLQEETLGSVGEVARTRSVDRRLHAGMSRHAQTTPVTLTRPSQMRK